jgi:hypothetical protein
MPDKPTSKKKNNTQSTLPTVEVSAPAPAWLKYQHQFEQTFPKSERIRAYLDPMARSLGNSESNYPDRIDKQYNRDMGDFVARRLMLDRNNEDFSQKEKQIIDSSRYAGTSQKYAYNNPVKLPVNSSDPYMSFLYQNDFLAKIPGIRNIIQHMAEKKISNQDIARGYHDNNNSGAEQQTDGDDPMDYRKNKVNMLSEYFHGDQGLQKSQYKPSKDYFPFLPSYSLKQKLGISENFADNMKQYTGDMESIKKQPLFLNGLGTAPYANQPDLGHYKSGVAYDKDREKPYYFVSDAWDFDPADYSSRYGANPQQAYQQAYLMNAIGNPFKVYDRFYFNPEDGSYIDDENSKAKKMKNGGKVSGKNKTMPIAALGYDLQSINTGFRGDPTALVNPIPDAPIKPIATESTASSSSSFNMPRMNIGLGPGIMGLAALVNKSAESADKSSEQSRQARIRAMNNGFNSAMYGNGSQLLFENGGSISNNKKIRQSGSPEVITPLSGNNFSQPVFEFLGPSHEQGGIPISYQGREVEVEGNETGYIDRAGDLNVFGNLKVPGTTIKFKTAVKRLAEQERKAVLNQQHAEKILSTITDPKDPIQILKLNSGNVQLNAAIAKQKALTQAKENISELQRTVLEHYNPSSNYPFPAKADNGIKLPASTGIDPWGLPETPPNVLAQAKKLNSDMGYQNYMMNNFSPVATSPNPPGTEPGIGIEKNNELDIKNINTPIYNRPLSFGQILPETLALATNRADSVPTYNYSPQLLSGFKVNFNDQLQENNNTFRTLVKQVGNNPAALSILAASKYQADTGVLGDQFRTNMASYFQRENQNTELINQARIQNLAMAERSDIARAQNEAASRATTREALRSIAGKSLQQKQANEELTLINQLLPYHRMDQQTGKWEFAGGPAPLVINGMPVYQQNNSVFRDQEQTFYTRDAKGKLISREKSKIPALSKIFRR